MIATEVISYTELIDVIRAKVAVLGLKYEDFDDLATLPAGFAGKALGPSHVRKFNLLNAFDALRAAGLRLKVEDDPEQDAKMRARIKENYVPRAENQARYNNHASTISSHVLSRAFGHILRKARKNRWAGTTKAERSEHARMMAMARHRKDRKRKKALHRRRIREREIAASAVAP